MPGPAKMRSVSETYGTNGGGHGFGDAPEPNRWTRCKKCAYGGPHVVVPVDRFPLPPLVLCGSCRHEVTA